MDVMCDVGYRKEELVGLLCEPRTLGTPPRVGINKLCCKVGPLAGSPCRRAFVLITHTPTHSMGARLGRRLRTV